jgi:hypothetical protein
MPGFEPGTSSLPRKRSTPELHRPIQGIERETRLELATLNLGRVVLYQLSYFPLVCFQRTCGERRIRTSEVVRQQIYSLPQLATLVSPLYFSNLKYVCHAQSRWRDSNPRPADYKSAALTN